MNWLHKCDPDWLEARRNYLSASDMAKLVPYTATGRPRANMDEAIRKVWASKQARISADDVVSTGVMARGHILEPYAIDALNGSGKTKVKMFHWDDTLIHGVNGVSCSPDGLNIEQPTGCPVSLASCDATVVCEVKSYNTQAHYNTAAGPAGALEERWQLATAFYVMPKLELAQLVFFNPLVRHPLFMFEYVRADLAAELKEIDDIVATYWAAAKILDDAADSACPYDIIAACSTEEDIVEALVAEADAAAGILNPK